jgi:serpin B
MTILTRRDLLRAAALIAVGLGSEAALAACGKRADPGDTFELVDGLAMSEVARATADDSRLADAALALRAFGADLYARLAGQPGNLVCSPYSVAVALAMTRNGGKGTTATEIDKVLHAPALDRFNGGLNAVALHLQTRAGERRRADTSKATISLDVANSLWGQKGVTWLPAFLDALARDYGSGMRLVDYDTDAEGARQLINTWTGQHTHGKVPELLPKGTVDALTRLVLVNAIYLKAPWEHPFEKDATTQARFTRTDGTAVTVSMMHADLASTGYATGPGWQAVDLRYAGSELAMAIVVPDLGRLDTVERGLDGPATARLLTGFADANIELGLPKWTFRTNAGLADILAALGMPTAFSEGADFSAMTTQERVHIGAVQHEAFIAVDEEGTEAAAATAVVMEASAGRAPSSKVTLTVDRPYLFLIYDVATAIPLFVGRVADPTT